MKKIWMFIIVTMLMVSSVEAVRRLYDYGTVPEDTGGYAADSYIPFGSNVNSGNLINSRCSMSGSSPFGILIMPTYTANLTFVREVVGYGAGTISLYDNNCNALNSTSVGGVIYTNGFITNINGNIYHEITLAVYISGDGFTHIKSYEVNGSQINLIKDVSIGDYALAGGLGCTDNINGNVYCGMFQRYFSPIYYRVNMTSSVVTSFPLTICTPTTGFTETRFVDYTSVIDYDANSATADDMLYSFGYLNLVSNMLVFTRAVNLRTGNEIYQDGCGIGIGAGTSQDTLIDVTPLQIGTPTSPLEYGIITRPNFIYDVKIFDNAGSQIYDFNLDTNPDRGLGSTFASADIDGNGQNEIVFVDAVGTVHVIANDMHQIASFPLTGYNISVGLIHIAIGEINSSSYGKELISDYGIFKLLTNTTVKLAQLSGINYPPSVSDSGIYNLVDTNGDGADELFYSKLAGGNFYKYNMATIVIPISPVPLTNTTPFICNFDSDTAGLPPQSCIKEDHFAFACFNPVLCNTGIDNSVFNSTPQSLAMRTDTTDEIFVYNNTIGNETGFLRIEFSLYNQFVNPVNSYLSINTYEDNPNATPSYGTLVDTAAMYENGTVTDGGFASLCSHILPVNKWVDIKYEINLTSGFANMYYNFSSCGVQHAFSNNPSATHLQGISIGSHQGFGFNIDNLRINEPPNVAPAPVTTTTSVVTTTVPPTTTTTLGGGGFCPNSICEAGESHASCPADCLILTCGDGVCDVANGETRITCPIDCSETGINSLVAPDDSSRGLLPEIASGLTMFITKGMTFFWVMIIIGIAIGILLLFTAFSKMISHR